MPYSAAGYACCCIRIPAIIKGNIKASSCCFASGCRNTKSRKAALFRRPVSSNKSSPKAARMAGSAAPFSAVRLRLTASASIKGTPKRANSAAAFDLPLPIPPVKPIQTVISQSRSLQPPTHTGRHLLIAHKHQPAGNRQTGAESKLLPARHTHQCSGTNTD